MQWASLEDTRALEEECTWAERDVPVTLYELLTRTKNNFGSRPAVSYQLTSGPKDKAETLSWNELHQKPRKRRICSVPGRGAKRCRGLYPTKCHRNGSVRFGGVVAGIVNPINLVAGRRSIAAILRETNAKVVVTLKGVSKNRYPTKGGRSGGRGPKCQSGD